MVLGLSMLGAEVVVVGERPVLVLANLRFRVVFCDLGVFLNLNSPALLSSVTLRDRFHFYLLFELEV